MAGSVLLVVGGFLLAFGVRGLMRNPIMRELWWRFWLGPEEFKKLVAQGLPPRFFRFELVQDPHEWSFCRWIWFMLRHPGKRLPSAKEKR